MNVPDGTPKNPSSWRALPANTVFALLSDETAVEPARSSLGQAGVSANDVEVWTGPDGAAALDVNTEDEGLFGQIARAVQNVGQGRAYLERYAQEVRAGKSLIAVGFEGEEEGDRVVAVLKECGGEQICRVGQWTVTLAD